MMEIPEYHSMLEKEANRLYEIAREYGKYPIDTDEIDKRIEEEKKYLKS